MGMYCSKHRKCISYRKYTWNLIHDVDLHSAWHLALSIGKKTKLIDSSGSTIPDTI